MVSINVYITYILETYQNTMRTLFDETETPLSCQGSDSNPETRRLFFLYQEFQRENTLSEIKEDISYICLNFI